MAGLDNCSFPDFKILDDSFLDAMDKACYRTVAGKPTALAVG